MVYELNGIQIDDTRFVMLYYGYRTHTLLKNKYPVYGSIKAYG